MLKLNIYFVIYFRYLRQNNSKVEKTIRQYDNILTQTQSVFKDKMTDYGATWRLLRIVSIVDQLYIKAKRIRSIQIKGKNKVGESIEGEFVAIYNYSIMALIQLKMALTDEPDISIEKAISLYDSESNKIKELMLSKNHDYGEAWRDMKVSSMTDFILVKIFRIKTILDNRGKTLVSEGIDSNLMDIANYAIFALILLTQKQEI